MPVVDDLLSATSASLAVASCKTQLMQELKCQYINISMVSMVRPKFVTMLQSGVTLYYSLAVAGYVVGLAR